MLTMTIGNRFCGPPGTGNGGYVCGLLARNIEGAAEVAMRAPVPLETALDVVEVQPGQWEARAGTKTVATGKRATLVLSRIERATREQAAAAEQRPVVRFAEHLVPRCFVCGHERQPGDGLRLFPGPLVPRRSGTAFAATWTPDRSLGSPDGRVASEFVWSALDCPTAYAVLYDPAIDNSDGALLLTATMIAAIDERPHVGEPCVITSWETAREGRKRTAEAALFGQDDRVLARARTLWIAPRTGG